MRRVDGARLHARLAQSLLARMGFVSGNAPPRESGRGGEGDADPEFVLVPGLRVSVVDDKLQLDTERGGEAGQRWPLDALELLSAFRHPVRLSAALAPPGDSPVEQQRRASWLSELVDAGFLVRADGQPSAPFGLNDQESWLHIAMLSDELRTSAYLDAVRAVVEPGDVVLDLGTGTGILAVAAAQAGARHVYAIEKGAIAERAARVFVDNGVADRITLIRELSTRVELPERANVLVTETFGDEPLSEQVLAYVGDAARRLLTPDARVVPSHVRILGCPLELSDDFLDNHIFDPGDLEEWSRLYDIDLRSLESVSQSDVRPHSQSPEEILSHVLLSAPVELCRIDLLHPPPRVDITRTVSASCDGRLDAALVFFELTLSEGNLISNNPVHPDAAAHWRIPLWLQPHRPPVKAGDELRLHYVFEGGRARVDVRRTD